jgi:hypothetical protein
MRIVPVYIQGRCEQSGLPKEKVSRYTVRPGTLGLTLVHSRLPCCTIFGRPRLSEAVTTVPVDI